MKTEEGNLKRHTIKIYFIDYKDNKDFNKEKMNIDNIEKIKEKN